MSGKVFFVGAGPGALDLLTVRAVRVLQCADVVLHDELVPQDFIELLPSRATVINVGKRCGKPGVSQETINAWMILHALQNRRVVRLKCGDPAIFGRLGEEIDALKHAGVSFEIVPGITAGLAAAAAAQISLTDRRFASRVVFATASLAGRQTQDWHALLREKTTLVIYMPGRDYRGLAAELVAAGASPDSGCAVISRASALDENIDCMRLRELPEFQSRQSPAVLIVGEAVRALVDISQGVGPVRAVPAELSSPRTLALVKDCHPERSDGERPAFQPEFSEEVSIKGDEPTWHLQH